MFVNIYGNKVEVEVSDQGMFYDKATKTVYAKTLSGLQKKLKEQKPTESRGIQIENPINGQKGMVTGRVHSTGWRRHYVTVRWENNTTCETSGNCLYKRLTDEERIKKEELKVAVEEAKTSFNTKQNEYNTYVNQFNASKILDEAFPVK